ncbi:MAG: DinB family protein [bacterium]|nr:DinB family protein [bacterium]
MNWKDMITDSINYNYEVTGDLFDLIDEDKLDWKPSETNNWMTMGQLLKHLSEGTGSAFKGFVTGDWGIPDGVNMEDMKPEEMLRPAEKLPSAESLSEAKEILDDDKKLALEMLEKCSEERLDTEAAPAPWDPDEMILGRRLMQMILHQTSHRHQLFYYLKLMGKPVNTGHLWGK